MKKELVEKLIDSAIIGFDGKCQLNYPNGLMLKGVMSLYNATNREEYKNFVLNYLDNAIDNSGNIAEYDMESYNTENISAGAAIFFAFDKTENEKYRRAIETLMEQIKGQPRNADGSFVYRKDSADGGVLEALYMADVFYMMYESRFGGKEYYNDIITQFKAARSGADFEGNTTARTLALYLMATIDTLEAIDQSVYEYYADLKQLYKEALGYALSLADTADDTSKAMIAYTMLKACRMKAILAEKYEDTAKDMFDGIDSEKLENVGPYMMAYSEIIR